MHSKTRVCIVTLSDLAKVAAGILDPYVEMQTADGGMAIRICGRVRFVLSEHLKAR